MKINFQNPPKNLDEKMVYNILRDYKILNCEVLIRDDEATVDDLIDVIMKNHRTYIKVSFFQGFEQQCRAPVFPGIPVAFTVVVVEATY
jgi:hypothetical protein